MARGSFRAAKLTLHASPAPFIASVHPIKPGAASITVATISKQDLTMPLTNSSAAFLLATMIYLGIRAVYKRKLASSKKTLSHSSGNDRGLIALVIVGQIAFPLLAILTPWLDWADYWRPAEALWLGACAMGCGVWLFWRSHADLGKNWSVTLELEQDHVLVTTGVYRLVRHPMYAAFFLMAIGQLALLPNWFAGPSALLAIALLYAVRKPREEAMLLQQFGDTYRQYIARTGGVMPRVRLSTGG